MIRDLNPSCNYKHCKSFFQISFQEMKWNKNALPILLPHFQLEEDIIYIDNNGKIRQRNFKVLDQYLCYKNKYEKTVWINYENSIIEIINDPIYGEGIRLIKCFDKLEFYGLVKQLFKLMKRYTIQYDFNEHYSLLQKLNKIKYGNIYKVKCKDDNLEYTVKIYNKQQIFDEFDREQLIKEISIIRQFQTDLTIKFYELFENQEQIYIIQEYINTHTLYEYVEKNPFFSEEKAAKVIFRIIKIVAYLHSKQIMYRDIKLENIIVRTLDNLDTLCFVDFRLAEYYNQNGNYQLKRCGTVGYVAPEVLKDEIYDLKVDIFSIGVVAYILLIGKEPFKGNYEEKLIQNLLCDINFTEFKINYNALDLLQGLLRIDPNERLSAHEALNHKWFKKEKVLQTYSIKPKFYSQKQKSKLTSLKTSLNFLGDQSPQSFKKSFRVKTLPDINLAISEKKKSATLFKRRITNILPLNPLYLQNGN